MSKLAALQGASSLSDLARLMGYSPADVSFILFKIPDPVKYRTFQIPKKAGGFRTIMAPEPRLAMLQKRLAEYLYQCISELQKLDPSYLKASHGFQRKRTIVTNAAIHVKKRYVFNIDLDDFFGSINFGRVRGFFVADKNYNLHRRVATVIAQIACHNNVLPQGSPCSPVISNLIGNLLDVRLLHLASIKKCRYSRYADDLTFSTNTGSFPASIALEKSGKWVVGTRLGKEISRAAFSINLSKVRMAQGNSQQLVTGLVVNKKVNISQRYYRNVRAMCNSLFQTGQYTYTDHTGEVSTVVLHKLEGMLSHIHSVKARTDRSHSLNRSLEKKGEFLRPPAPIELYWKYIFFKNFAAPVMPTIYTEGKSDIVYLKCAIKSLCAKYPSLAGLNAGKGLPLSFFKLAPKKSYISKLGEGTSGQVSLIRIYRSMLKEYKYKPRLYPVVIVCDNDDGLSEITKVVKKEFGIILNVTTSQVFYHITDNLYVVKTPENLKGGVKSCIEDLFPPKVLATKIGGKPFDRNKQHQDHTSYGKQVFADKVVLPNCGHIDFTGFEDLLSRIEGCFNHYVP